VTDKRLGRKAMCLMQGTICGLYGSAPIWICCIFRINSNKKAGTVHATESVLHRGLRVCVISYYVGINHFKLEEME
jgi:hypothetical protein